MNDCDYLLSRDIKPNCEEPLVKGIEKRGVLINRADIALGAVIRDAADPKHVITTLPLNAGKRGFEVIQPGKTPFSGTKTDMEEGTYGNTFAHEAPIVILDNGPEVAAQVDDLANGDYVLIIENISKGMMRDGNSAFQIYGFHQGLRASAGTSEKWSDETRSGWSVTLKETQAPVSALYLHDTSYAKTKAAFESLMAIAAE